MAADMSQLELPLPSGNCKQAIEIITGNNADIKAIEAAIAGDALLSNAVIRYSNSPVHHREVEIGDVGTATNILGLKNVHVVLVTAVLKNYMQESLTGDRILQHCLTISALCSLLAARVSKQLQYEMELVGILHDLPSLVLCHNYRPEYRALIKGMKHNSPPLEQAEQDIFRITRQALMEQAVAKLLLPEKIQAKLIMYHASDMEQHLDKDRYLAVLCLAHHMEVNLVPTKLRLPDSLRGEKEQLLSVLGLTNTDYTELVNTSQEVINEHIALVA